MLVIVSRLVKIKSILSSAELFTFFAVIALAGQMLGFYVVPHICSLCTSVFTVTALPQTFIVLPHLLFYFFIYTLVWLIYCYVDKIQFHIRNKTYYSIIYIYLVSSKLQNLVFISWLMNIERILRPAELVTFLAVIALAGHVVHFYVVSHIGCLWTCISTITALPQTIQDLPHLVSQFLFCTQSV